MAVEIRQLTPADAAAFQALRLRSLREAARTASRSIGISHSSGSRPLTAILAQRLEAARTPTGKIVFGAFANGALVGVVGCVQEARVKSPHKAPIWGMYVAPEVRARALGGRCSDRAVLEARAGPGPNVERITLSAVERATAARALYRSAGFKPYAREVDAFRQNGRSDTLEYVALEVSDRVPR